MLGKNEKNEIINTSKKYLSGWRNEKEIKQRRNILKIDDQWCE